MSCGECEHVHMHASVSRVCEENTIGAPGGVGQMLGMLTWKEALKAGARATCAHRDC